MADDVIERPDLSLRAEPVPDHDPPRFHLALYNGDDRVLVLFLPVEDGRRALWLDTDEVAGLAGSLATLAGKVAFSPEELREFAWKVTHSTTLLPPDYAAREIDTLITAAIAAPGSTVAVERERLLRLPGEIVRAFTRRENRIPQAMADRLAAAVAEGVRRVIFSPLPLATEEA